MDQTTIRRTIPILLCVLGAGFVALAGPFVPKSIELPDDIKSLANMSSIGLRLEPLPATILNAGVTRQGLREKVTRRLTDAGFHINDPTKC